METPKVKIDLQGLKENLQILLKRCQGPGVCITPVLKGVAGDIRVAQTLALDTVHSIGDSRLQNIKSFKEAGIQQEILLLRIPQTHEYSDVVRLTEISLQSQSTCLRGLSQAAKNQGKEHGVILMIDVGDLREGVMPAQAEQLVSTALGLPGLVIKGLGTNVGCYGGVLPCRENTEILLTLKERLETRLGIRLPLISGGNTATTILLDHGRWPYGLNHLRIGEAILQGTDITNQRTIPYLRQNNFILEAEIVEVETKPSLPRGQIGVDAFGNRPQWTDQGLRQRAILAVGRQDVKVEGMAPFLEGASILGASSDYLLVDITDTGHNLKVGDTMEFRIDYGGVLQAMTSKYVAKEYTPPLL